MIRRQRVEFFVGINLREDSASNRRQADGDARGSETTVSGEARRPTGHVTCSKSRVHNSLRCRSASFHGDGLNAIWTVTATLVGHTRSLIYATTGSVRPALMASM